MVGNGGLMSIGMGIHAYGDMHGMGIWDWIHPWYQFICMGVTGQDATGPS